MRLEESSWGNGGFTPHARPMALLGKMCSPVNKKIAFGKRRVLYYGARRDKMSRFHVEALSLLGHSGMELYCAFFQEGVNRQDFGLVFRGVRLRRNSGHFRQSQGATAYLARWAVLDYSKGCFAGRA